MELDKVGSRRLIIYIRDYIKATLLPYQFEINDNITRTCISSEISDFLQDLVNRRAISDFVVFCNETNNSPDVIDRNELYVDVKIKRTRAAETTVLWFKICPSESLLEPNVEAFERAMKMIE